MGQWEREASEEFGGFRAAAMGPVSGNQQEGSAEVGGIESKYQMSGS